MAYSGHISDPLSHLHHSRSAMTSMLRLAAGSVALNWPRLRVSRLCFSLIGNGCQRKHGLIVL